MKTPKEKYLNDPEYYHFVDIIEKLIEQARFTPSEIREMCMLACINYEMRHMRESEIPMQVKNSIEILENFVTNNRRESKRNGK